MTLPKADDLTGFRFGKLLVRSKHSVNKNGHVLWNCVCDCGNEVVVFSSNLKRKNTSSCGCYHKSIATGDGLSAARQVYCQYKHSAKKRNYCFDITFEQFCELSKQPCTYCGRQPQQRCEIVDLAFTFTYNGIDRRDNTKGYVLDNCYPCCGRCNKAKMNMTHEEFIRMCNEISALWKVNI